MKKVMRIARRNWPITLLPVLWVGIPLLVFSAILQWDGRGKTLLMVACYYTLATLIYALALMYYTKPFRTCPRCKLEQMVSRLSPSTEGSYHCKECNFPLNVAVPVWRTDLRRPKEIQ